MSLSPHLIAQISEYLQGSPRSIDDAVIAFELDDEVDGAELEKALLEADTQLCTHCGWWHEVCELKDSEDHGGGVCEQCCEELGIEFDE